jgi:hypothetical protein
MTVLVEKTLWAWHDRNEKGLTMDTLVVALRKLRLHKAAGKFGIQKIIM